MWTSGTKFADILCGPKCETIRLILTLSTNPFVFEDFQLVPLSVFSLWETTLAIGDASGPLAASPLSLVKTVENNVDFVFFFSVPAASEGAVELHTKFSTIICRLNSAPS